jgi:2-dehydropantoate 2-reductase
MQQIAQRIAQRIAVMGAGAVGSYFGGMLARAGADVTLIARGEHLEALRRDGLFIDSKNFQERVPVRASEDSAAVRDAELILFSVKTTGTADAARSIAPHLGPGAIVLSMQNGVDNVEQIGAASGIPAFAAVVYVAASLPEPGRMRHEGRGDLVVGDERREQIAVIAETFAHAGVKCRITDNIEGELWKKFLLNCAGNAVTALGRAPYSVAAYNEFAWRVVAEALTETRNVANAAGVQLPSDSADAAGVIETFKKYGAATSSTLQDIVRGRHTEIDSLNGYVARRGDELGVPVPVNRTLHALVKLLEASL